MYDPAGMLVALGAMGATEKQAPGEEDDGLLGGSFYLEPQVERCIG